MAVPGVDHTYAPAEINQPVSIRIRDDCTLGMHHRDRGYRGDTTRNGLGPPSQQGAALGAGHFRPELDDAGHLHPEGKGWSDVEGREDSLPIRWSIHDARNS